MEVRQGQYRPSLRSCKTSAGKNRYRLSGRLCLVNGSCRSGRGVRQSQLSTRVDEAEYCTLKVEYSALPTRVLVWKWDTICPAILQRSSPRTQPQVCPESTARVARILLSRTQNITESRGKTRRYLAFDSITFDPRLSNIFCLTQ